jgi:hypothetical protein
MRLFLGRIFLVDNGRRFQHKDWATDEKGFSKWLGFSGFYFRASRFGSLPPLSLSMLGSLFGIMSLAFSPPSVMPYRCKGLTMDYLVISVRNNIPYPYGFGDKADALEFYLGQHKEGWIYTTLWSVNGETLNPLDPEAVERNLKTSGVWL